MLEDKLQSIRANCLGKNVSLPAWCYVEEAFLELELDRIFRHGWHCLGRVDEVPDVGDFFTTTLVGEPLVIVRSEASQISVLSNVCRHRAMPVAQGAGHTDRFACPYHAWNYQLDGALLSAPLMKSKVAIKNCRLPQLRSECWQGFIFANLDSEAISVAVLLEDLNEAIGNYQPGKMHHIGHFEEVWDCNWKSLTENFMDSYHLSVVHPQSLRPLTPTNLCDTLAHNKNFTSYVANYAKSAPARNCHASTLTDEQRRQSRLFCVYPSMVASVSPDTLVYLALQPQGVAQVKVKWGVSVFEKDLPPDQRAERITKWQQINAEDHRVLAGLQAGLRSAFYQGGPLAPPRLEGCISHFHDYLIASLSD